MSFVSIDPTQPDVLAGPKPGLAVPLIPTARQFALAKADHLSNIYWVLSVGRDTMRGYYLKLNGAPPGTQMTQPVIYGVIHWRRLPN
ncbi:MAG: hypothetical protein AB7T63_08010 [Planctomycetota bacterium]